LISAPVLITDSCVLIDYAKSAKDALMMLAREVRVVVPRILLVEEVHDLSINDAPTEALLEAARMPRPLSSFDWLCLILARDNHWTCVSNDKRLRAQCLSVGVRTQWSLEPLVLLVRRKKLPKERAEKIARAMAEQNPFRLSI
jgi:hypothetical protein